jgi:hypothetical protein
MAPLTMISVLLNGIVITAGVRNIMAPGTPLVMIPEDNVFQEHFHGILDVINDGDPKMAFIFQLLGIFFVMVAAAKLATVFAEPSPHRRVLCLAFGAGDFVVTAITSSYKGLPPSVLAGFSILHALEGSAFLADGLFGNKAVAAQDPAATAESETQPALGEQKKKSSKKKK